MSWGGRRGDRRSTPRVLRSGLVLLVAKWQITLICAVCALNFGCFGIEPDFPRDEPHTTDLVGRYRPSVKSMERIRTAESRFVREADLDLKLDHTFRVTLPNAKSTALSGDPLKRALSRNPLEDAICGAGNWTLAKLSHWQVSLRFSTIDRRADCSPLCCDYPQGPLLVVGRGRPYTLMIYLGDPDWDQEFQWRLTENGQPVLNIGGVIGARSLVSPKSE
jgi:hypothetical protein